MTEQPKVFEIAVIFKESLRTRQLKYYSRALTYEHALEKMYQEVGSRHRVKRTGIKILSHRIVENIEEIPDRFIVDIMKNDDFVFPTY
ncbi:MAG: 50S ribosomal protein L18a [Candidatus Heimdallarchaeota archaeon]|nr:50S ribosomal protein L18a [Candidatus Heimdallarchaeota archaeon]MCK5048236.1 50S ribosomal protein L18a [Candidatus Heimdallarchaeota archaeon]